MSDYPLVTIEEARTYLGLGSSDDDVHLAEDLASRATDYCERYCNRPLAARAFTALRCRSDQFHEFRPLAIPIDLTQTLTISFDGTAQTIWKAEADGDRSTFDVLVRSTVPELGADYFWRREGWWCHTDPDPILITYTGGLDPIPGELKDACLLVIDQIHGDQVGKTTDVVSHGPGPVTSSVTYMGSLIPLKAKQILDFYRRIPW